MSMHDILREAIIGELRRQADNSDGALRVEPGDDPLTIHGPVDLEDLIMVIAGSIAGGP